MAKTFDKDKKKVDISVIAEDMGGRKPPQALEIEEAVLGALLLEPNDIADVLDQITAECFYKESHKKIFTAICDVFRRNDPVDILTVVNELTTQGELDNVGGSVYISQLSLKTGSAAHLEYHAKILLQKYIQRELISISYDVQKQAFDDTMPADKLVDSAEQKIFALAERNMKRETTPIKTVIYQTYTEISENQKKEDGLSGVPSGFNCIDNVTYGWQKADLIVLAARPSVGKTAFVLSMARNMAVSSNIPVAMFSLEMPSTQLVMRLLVGETGLPTDKLKGAKKLTKGDWAQLDYGLKSLAKAPLFLDDTPSLSIFEFRSKARRLVNYSHVQMIIIDYLQLMTGPPELKGMREQEVSSISRSLKAIAKELAVPIIALSQLNRSVEIRGGNKRPQLSDLRESGAIEQDADIVMFLHRPEVVGTEDRDSSPGDTTLIIAKHRNGETKDIPMRFIKSEMRFIEAERDQQGIPSKMNQENRDSELPTSSEFN
ncbi:MAG: replicative DNA helicase [Bacteroidales bacterium]|nr:replicative DNA helicase [Bacteroidales bacterium]